MSSDKIIEDLIFEGKSVSEVKETLTRLGFKPSEYDKCSKSGKIKEWRKQKGLGLRKKLLDRNGLLLTLRTWRYLEGMKYRFTSGLFLELNGKSITRKPLFTKSDSASESHARALKCIGPDYGKSIESLIHLAELEAHNFQDELDRINKALQLDL